MEVARAAAHARMGGVLGKSHESARIGTEQEQEQDQDQDQREEGGMPPRGVLEP